MNEFAPIIEQARKSFINHLDLFENSIKKLEGKEKKRLVNIKNRLIKAYEDNDIQSLNSIIEECQKVSIPKA